MNKTLIARILIAVFMCNLLAPGAEVFAQERIGQPKYNMTGYKTEIIDGQYAPLHYDKERDISIVYQAEGSVGLINNAQYVDDAQVRLFLNAANDVDFFDFLLHNPLNKNVIETALKRLNLMLETNSLNLFDAVSLIDAPTDEIALFGATFLNISLNGPIQDKSIPLLQQFVEAFQTLPQFLTERLAKIKKPTASREAASLWAGLHEILAQWKTIADLTGQTELLPVQQQKELAQDILNQISQLSSNNEASLVLAENGTLALMKYQGANGFKAVVETLDAKNTKLFGQKNPQLRGDYSDLIGAAFNAFSADFVPRLQGKGKPITRQEIQNARNVLFQFTNSGYSTAVYYGALTTLASLYRSSQNLLPGAPTSSALPQPLIKGLKYSLITDKEAQEVADRIKRDFYCRMAGSSIRQFGYNSQEMAIMLNVLAKYYNNIRLDNQHTLVELNEAGKPVQNVCVVSANNQPNKHLSSKEQSDQFMLMLLSWPVLDFTFSYLVVGVKYTWKMGRLANAAAKLPAGTRLDFMQKTLQEARRMSQLEKGLADIGVTLEKETVRYGRFSGKVKAMNTENVFTKTRGFNREVPDFYPAYHKYANKRVNGRVVKTKEVESYQVRQFFPDGMVKTQKFGPEVIRTDALNAVVPASQAGAQGIRNIDDLINAYVTKVDPAKFGGKQAYTEILAAQQVLYRGAMIRDYQVRSAAMRAFTKQTPSALPGSTLAAALYPDAVGGMLYASVPVLFDVVFAPTDFFAKAEMNRREKNKTIDRQNRIAEQKREANEDYAQTIKELSNDFYDEENAPQLYSVEETTPAKARKTYADALAEGVKESPLGAAGATFDYLFTVIGNGFNSFVKAVQAPAVKDPMIRRRVMQNNPYMKMYQQKAAQAEQEYQQQLQKEYQLQEEAIDEQIHNDLGLHPDIPLTQAHRLKWQQQKEKELAEYYQNFEENKSLQTVEDWDNASEENIDDWYF